MFDLRKNKNLHMRNLNQKLSLHDVVGFHEIIKKQQNQAPNVSSFSQGMQSEQPLRKRPQTAKASTSAGSRGTFTFSNQDNRQTPRYRVQSGVLRNMINGSGSDLAPVDSLIKIQNEKTTLQYFSNMSTVRDACTKQHLDEFIGMMQRSGDPHVMLLDSIGEEDRKNVKTCARRARMNERLKETIEGRQQRVKDDLVKFQNMPGYVRTRQSNFKTMTRQTLQNADLLSDVVTDVGLGMNTASATVTSPKVQSPIAHIQIKEMI